MTTVNTTTIKVQDVTEVQVIGVEWFDKRYGNSYFSARAYGLVSGEWVTILAVPFEYGYGDQYLTATADALNEAGFFDLSDYDVIERPYSRGRDFYLKPLRVLLGDRKIKLHVSITTGRKRDVIAWGEV